MGSALNSIVNVALTAIGGAFGGPIGMMVAQLAKQLLLGIVDQVIQQLPISQEFKDLLQAAFHAGMGDVGGAIQNANEFVNQLGQQMGGSPADIGNMQRSIDELRTNVNDMMSQMIAQQGLDREDEGGGSGGAGGKPGSGRAGGAPGWLRAMAEALGKQLDELADEMQAAADAINKEDPSTSADFQVISQQFSILMNAVSTAIKAVGESMSGMARKQ